MKLPSVGSATWLALLTFFTLSLSKQIPILKPDSSGSISKWKLDFSSEAPHYFASVFGLLQQWPQTFFPNGHSIVPCEVPPFTKLYHGRMDGHLPPNPEWVAFDAAMSYGIMGSTRNTHLLTYQTTRSAKCIYFDGESATLFGTGQLDTQMLHIWGNLSGPETGQERWFLFDEYGRAEGLCNWLKAKKLGGLGWGYEGIVRMNAGFEMIWCNFTSPSIKLISHLNVTAPLLPQKNTKDVARRWEPIPSALSITTPIFPLPTAPERPPDIPEHPIPPGGFFDRGREPFQHTQDFEWYLSSTIHYGSSRDSPGLGEYRVKLNTCGFLSYYDPIFQSQGRVRAEKEQKSLNLTHEGIWKGWGNGTRQEALEMLSRRRRLHTLDQLSSSDAAVMRARSEAFLNASLSAPDNCSGLDWFTLTNDIVQTYAQPIHRLSKTLATFENNTSNKTIFRDWAVEIRDQTHAFLMPFHEYFALDSHENASTTQNPELTYSRCRYQHTRLLQPDQDTKLGAEEPLLKWAVEETQGTICTVLIEISLAVESFWQTTFNHALQPTLHHAVLESLRPKVQHWQSGLEELMAWLGWVGEYTGCDEKCSWDETCYIPMWPLIPMNGNWTRFNGSTPGYGFYPNPNRTFTFPPYGFGNPFGDSEADLWTPKCKKKSFFVSGRRM